jgi:DNA-binding beta-propeller fold protein YncE
MKSSSLISTTVLAILAMPASVSAQRSAFLAVTVASADVVNLYSVDGPQLKLVKMVSVGKSPGRMCLDPADSTLYVVVGTGAAAVDLNSQTVTGTMGDPAIQSPYGCIVSPDSRKLYLTDRKANTVFVFSLPGHQLLKKISVPDDVRHGIYTTGHKSLIFSCGSGELAVVDPASDTVARTIRAVGLDPRNMVITPDGRYLAVALVSSDLMSWYHADTLEPVNSFGVTRSPQGMVVAPNGERIYVTGYYEGVIGVIDLREKNAEGIGEWRQTSTIPVGPAFSIAISSDSNYLYVCPADGVLTAVDLRSWKMVKSSSLKGAGNVLYINKGQS